MKFYDLKFYNLTSTGTSPAEISFTGGDWKAKYMLAVLTWKLARSYRSINVGVTENNDEHDLVYFDKKSGQHLVGLTIDVTEVPPEDFSFSL